MTNHSPKSPPSTIEIRPTFSSLAGAHDAGLLEKFLHFNIFVFAWAIHIINVTDRYVSISVNSVSLKCHSYSKNYCYRLSLYCYLFFTNIVGYFCRVFVFEIGQIMVNYGAFRSLRTCKRRAQDSQVKVVSLLKCRSLSKLSIIVH